MVFRPHPRHALANTPLEVRWHDSHSRSQRFLRLFDPTKLSERSGEPTVRVRKIGVRSDGSFRHLDGGHIARFAALRS
jgi:hypothetical protein